MLTKLKEIHFRNRYLFFTFVILVSIIGSMAGRNLPIGLNLTDLLPDNRESVLDMNSVIKEVGGVGYMIVLLGPVDNPEKYLPVIADSIKNNSQIRYFFYEREEYLLQDRALYLLSKKEFNDLRKHASNLFSDEENSSSLLDLGLEEDVDLKDKKEEAKKYFEKFRREKEVKKRYYLSKDGRYAMFLIKPSFDSVDLDSSSKLAADLNAALKSALGDIKFNLIGRYIEKVHDRDQFNRDIVRTGTITFVALSFILVLGLGTFRGALVTNVAVIISLGWTVGIALLFVGRINILTSFLLAILGGLGAEYGIHLLRRYFQARQEGMSAEEGINFTYDNMGRALFSAAVTSAAAFLILYISDFRGFSELGVIAGLGILAIFFVYIMAFPLIGKWLGDAPRFSKTAALFGFYPFSIGWKWIYFPVALLLAYGLRHAEFEYDFERMHDLTKETQKMNSLASKLFGKSLVPAALQVTDYDQTMELAEWLKESRQQRYVQDVVTISSLVPDDMSSRYRKMQKLKKMIEKTSPAEIEEKTGLRYDKVIRWVSEAPYTKDDLPPQLQNAFGQEGTIVLAYPKEQQTTAAALQNFAKLLRTAKKKFPGLKVGSDTLVFVEILDHIMVDGKVVLALFALGAFLVFWLDFRSFYSALLLESQLVVGMILLVAAMGLFGVRFTILNVAMIPAVLAAGIDMGVHIRHRELETLGEGESSSVASARYIAQAVHLSALTTIVGFGSLFFAEAGMLKGIAWISVLGQVSMYLVCMVLFPIFRDGIAIVKRNYAK